MGQAVTDRGVSSSQQVSDVPGRLHSNKAQVEGQVYPNDVSNPSVFEVALNKPGTSPKKVRPKTCTTDLMNVAILIKKVVPCPCPTDAARSKKG